MKETYRIIKAVESQDGNLVVAIRKYNWIECLFHSFYGFLLLVLFGSAIVLVLYGQWLWAIVPFLISLFCWVKAWLGANDRLKGRIYTELLEQHLLKKNTISAPFITKRYYPGIDVIKSVDEKGDDREYKVEFMQEELPLYVVKLIVKE